MASAYKNIAKLIGSTGDVTIYTCPSETQAIIKNIQLYNSHSGTIVVYPKITDSSASVTVTLEKNSIGTLADTSLTGPFVLEASDALILNCDTADKIYAFASVLEIS
jgi:hypothetical protein|tara:strand:+ start:1931 stop:2251 length:321 start_codon:yes stop_codon:yes gene_type:complete